ncbi:MAG: DUF1045 domain-containing protein [Paracoccaceae bacterium]
MEGYQRYAIYYAPEPGVFANFCAKWLGWDAESGRVRAHPVIRGLPRKVADLTAAPRVYGFHGTIKAPFRLAEGADIAALHAAMLGLCGGMAAVQVAQMALQRLGGFVALVPVADAGGVADLAATVVAALDGFRAPLEADEIARRRPERLSGRQQDYLARWGYPYVMEEFRFHLTLTGDLPEDEADQVLAVLEPVLTPLVPQPFRVGSLCLFGQQTGGRFRMLHRYALGG